MSDPYMNWCVKVCQWRQDRRGGPNVDRPSLAALLIQGDTRLYNREWLHRNLHLFILHTMARTGGVVVRYPVGVVWEDSV